MNTAIKNILAASVIALSTASTAYADKFYIDNGIDHSTPGTQAVATGTGIFDEMTYHYWSSTVMTDANNDGIFSAGDTFVSTGGLDNTVLLGVGSNSISQNSITGFVPQYVFGGNPATDPSTNDFGGSWNMSFGFSNLAGHINAAGGFIYTSGDIVMKYYDVTNATGIDIFNLAVQGGTNNGIGQSLDLFGELSILNGGSAVDGGLTVNDLFYFADGTSFFDYINSGPGMSIGWNNDQNTSPFWVNGTQTTNPADIGGIYGGVAGGTGVLSGEHDGSLRVVPEPAPIALLALGLLGIAGMRKIKAS